jgi:hypothetical protein
MFPNVCPLPTVKATCTAPEVAPLPELLTAIVYVAFA